ncbi:MAG: PAC2 family protein [Frankiaceae bacterium]|nr:PAC2 family protein [Frankiaceae bacterium]MBV9869146.1 PAC2 family protein [Frankiaceae bacterium]
MIAAFEGWNDAADAATGAIEHLEQEWQVTPFALIDPEDYYDFQVNRPTVRLVDGVTRRLEWPTTRLGRTTVGDREVVLVRGLEPNMRWRAFCDELVEFANELEVTEVVCLAALLADVPHTRPIDINGSASDEALAEALGIKRSRYEGPTGIVSVFHQALAETGRKVVTYWASVPHYVAQPPCPKATLTLLHRLEDALDFTIPLGDLPDQALAWENGVDELAREDSEIADYIASLEEREDELDLPEASGDAIAKAFERYLRRRDT